MWYTIIKGDKYEIDWKKKYLNTLIDVINTPDIKVITGVRSSGKSKLLDAFYDYLTTLNNVNIIRIKLNLKKYEKLLNPEELYKYIDNNYKESVTNFLLIDETLVLLHYLRTDEYVKVEYILKDIKEFMYYTGSMVLFNQFLKWVTLSELSHSLLIIKTLY